MLRLTLLAACLLAALQISNVAGISPYREKYLKRAYLPEGPYIRVENYTSKIGEKKMVIDDKDLLICETPSVPGTGPSLSVKVVDFLQYAHITLAGDLNSAVVSRTEAVKEASIFVEKRCPHPHTKK